MPRIAVFIVLTIIAWFFELGVTQSAPSSPPLTASTPYATVAPRILAKAKEWFRRLQTARIDRSQLTKAVNAQLTEAVVKEEQSKLSALGSPLSFTFVGSTPIGDVMGYNFIVVLPSARVDESIAFDRAGKIAGLNFEVFRPLNQP